MLWWTKFIWATETNSSRPNPFRNFGRFLHLQRMIKSTRPGFTLCFLLVHIHVRRRSNLTSHVKPFALNLRYSRLRKYKSDEMCCLSFSDVDPRSQLWHWLTKMFFLHDTFRTTHPVTTKPGNSIHPSYAYYLIGFLINSVELFFSIFKMYFGCICSRSNTLFAASQDVLVGLMLKENEVHRLDIGWPCDINIWSPPWYWPWNFQGHIFEIAVS